MAQDSLIANSVRPPQSFHTFANQNHRKSSFNSKTSKSLECRVCEEGFSLGGDKVPRLLFCGHTLCHSCLLRLNTMESNILCPFDRQPTPIGQASVWGLKKNFALLELLERLIVSQSQARFSSEILVKQRELGIACDEDEEHVAVLYCTVCSSHLCMDCSEQTHATKTLHQHRRIPLSEKPREKPRCPDHSSHPVEFVCLEESCRDSPLMCFICKDYKHTKHQHALLEQEAERIRNVLSPAMQHMRRVAKDLTEAAQKLENVARQLEGQQNCNENSANEVDVNGEGESTAQEAYVKVRQHFDQLREHLNKQEVIALTTLDTHIRERLCTIRQQQEDLTGLLSQMVGVLVDGERLLQQDDGRFVLASGELLCRIEQVSSQEPQVTETMSLTPDPTIPLIFTKDNRIHIGARIEMRIVTLGLDSSGKTSILFKLKNDEFVSSIPTIGFNVETIEYNNIKFTIWDVGGQPKLRPLWRHYYFNTQAVIFVIDATCKSRYGEAQTELTKLMEEKELKDAAFLIFANKEECPPKLSSELADALDLSTLCLGRTWNLQACNAQSGYGLYQGLDWLARQLVPLDILNALN